MTKNFVHNYVYNQYMLASNFGRNNFTVELHCFLHGLHEKYLAPFLFFYTMCKTVMVTKH